jgi:hypothetical protein
MKINTEFVIVLFGAVMLFGVIPLANSIGHHQKPSQVKPTPSETSLFAKPSDKVFRFHLARMVNSKDEFDGSITLTTPVFIGDDLSDGDETAGLDIDIHVMKKKKPTVTLLSSYSGSKWMFHDFIEVKSGVGYFTKKVPFSSLHNDVSGGTVFEVAGLELGDSEFANFCKIVGGRKPLLRLTGSIGQAFEASGRMTQANVSQVEDACISYAGILNLNK